LRPERDALRELLIRTVAVAGRPSDEDALARVVDAAPVNALPAAAALHRVGGTVLRGLNGVDGVPDEVRERLGALRHQSSLRHLLLTGALSDIGSAFDDAGVDWVVMKGPVVAALLYPEPGDRSYADLDLLVARRHYPAAMRVLESLGYQHVIHNWALAEQMLAGQVAMKSPSVNIDLHWHLHYSREDRRPFALDPEAMIERRRFVAVSGMRAPVLDPVDNLLTLTFHAARSDGHRLIWLKDIERAVSIESPDFDELVRRCRSYRCAPPVGVMLGRARTYLDAPVPREIIESMTPPILRATHRSVCALSNPVQLHERPTLTRVFTRSMRSSFSTSVSAIPARCVRQLGRNLCPPLPNETDDPLEKLHFLAAVTGSAR
jgi:hypothetical protein